MPLDKLRGEPAGCSLVLEILQHPDHSGEQGEGEGSITTTVDNGDANTSAASGGNTGDVVVFARGFIPLSTFGRDDARMGPEDNGRVSRDSFTVRGF
jgi:hypothetical protein